MSDRPTRPLSPPRGPLNSLIRFCLEQKLVVAIVLIGTLFWGVLVAPFDWDLGELARDPVPVDAIPDIGENQQIVFTEWPGRSPQDIDDQISYPMTIALLGIPGVKDIRSYSVFGFSTIYIVFDDGIEFYWSRSRVLEKLNSLPAGTLPPGVSPALGPDATALGQVFWYTLEGHDAQGNPTGGWDPHELRSIQDFIVKYKLAGVEGVSEVASIGGFVREVMWDGIDFHRARMEGYRTRSFRDEELRIIHLRLMGSTDRSVYRGRMRWGAGQWFMGSAFAYVVVSGLFRMRERPFVIGGLLIIAGYCLAAIRRVERYDVPGFRTELHRWQWARLGQLARGERPS